MGRFVIVTLLLTLAFVAVFVWGLPATAGLKILKIVIIVVTIVVVGVGVVEAAMEKRK